MTTYETSPASLSQAVPVDTERFRQFAHLYSWQDRTGIDICGTFGDEPDTLFALRFYGGEDYPTYKLELARQQRVERTVRFFMYLAGQSVHISPLSTDKHPAKALSESDVELVLQTIPLALQAALQKECRKRPFRLPPQKPSYNRG